VLKFRGGGPVRLLVQVDQRTQAIGYQERGLKPGSQDGCELLGVIVATALVPVVRGSDHYGWIGPRIIVQSLRKL
jgi:hypothetical protein